MKSKQHVKLVLKKNNEIVDSSEFDSDLEDDNNADNYTEALNKFAKVCKPLEDEDTFSDVFDLLAIDEETRIEIDSDYTIESV